MTNTHDYSYILDHFEEHGFEIDRHDVIIDNTHIDIYVTINGVNMRATVKNVELPLKDLTIIKWYISTPLKIQKLKKMLIDT